MNYKNEIASMPNDYLKPILSLIHPNQPNTFKFERNIAIFRERNKGKTLSEIGKEYSIGKERVRQICDKIERIYIRYKIKKEPKNDNKN